MSSTETARERHDLSPRGRRFLEVATLALSIMAAGMPAAEAKTPTRSPDNPWAQLMGENTEERNQEIAKLERECTALEGTIARLEGQLAHDDARYARDPGLRFQEEGKLAEARGELRRKEAAVRGLEAGLDRGLAREQERRANYSDTVEGTVLGFTGPRLDLSAGNLANNDIAAYYAKNHIGWKDHALYMDTKGNERVKLTVEADVTDAHFYFQDKGHDLLIVLTMTDAQRHQIVYKTVRLDNGLLDGFYESDDQGKPKAPESD